MTVGDPSERSRPRLPPSKLLSSHLDDRGPLQKSVRLDISFAARCESVLCGDSPQVSPLADDPVQSRDHR